MSNLIPRPGTSPVLLASVDGQPLPPPVVSVAESQDGDFNLGELWAAIKRRRRLVAVTAGAVLLITALHTARQRLFNPVYEGSFNLLITDPISSQTEGGRSSSSGGNTVIEQLARNTTEVDIPTLMEVLRSPLLLEPIARRFDTSASDLAGRIAISTGGDRRQSAEGVLKVALTGTDPLQAQQQLQALSQVYLNYSQQQRQQRLAEGIKFLDRQAPLLQAKSNEIQSELARFRRTHNLLEPNVEGGALREQVAAQQEQQRGLQAERARLQAVRRGIEDGSLTAVGFQEAVSTGSGGDSGGGGGVSITSRSQSMLEQLADLEKQLAEARARYTPSSSMVRGLQARRDRLAAQVRSSQIEAVDAALALNANRLAANQGQINQLNRAFQLQPALIKQYDELQQRLRIANDNLAAFLQTRETFQLEIAQRTVPWQVIAKPQINPDPVKPSVPRDLLQGALLGLVAGAGAGLLRDRLDHVFHNPQDVREELNEPLLGHIPHISYLSEVRRDQRFLLEELDRTATEARESANGERATDNVEDRQLRYQRFFYQEAFRNLYTSLRFLNAERPLRSVALTSSLPAEGKSLVNVLLAKTLSELGQRVLLVDGDMRKPQLHKRLGIDNLRGLSNLLTGDVSDWREVVQPVTGYPNWRVLTAGLRPPDPTRLLSSQRMQELIRALADSGDFDLILYDTPPVLGLADAALLAEHLDGLVLIVSLERVDRSLPREAINRIRSARAQLLGVITNAVREDVTESRAYGYRYGYRYGYGSYDYRTAYSYYAEDDETGDSPTPSDVAATAPTPQSLPTLKRGLARLKRQLRQSLNWLDR